MLTPFRSKVSYRSDGMVRFPNGVLTARQIGCLASSESPSRDACERPIRVGGVRPFLTGRRSPTGVGRSPPCLARPNQGGLGKRNFEARDSPPRPSARGGQTAKWPSQTAPCSRKSREYRAILWRRKSRSDAPTSWWWAQSLRTGLRAAKFPANREKNWELEEKVALSANMTKNQPLNSMRCRQIP
jgi:hypothetical protein